MSAPSSGPPIIFDTARRQQRLTRSAKLFAKADFLHRRAAEDAAHTLSAILREFKNPVDLSPHQGVLAEALHGLPAADPAREQQQIARLRALAKEAQLDPEIAEKFLNFVIREVIRHHERIAAGNGRSDRAGAGSEL